MMYTVTFSGNLTQAESALVKRGTIQIAALLAAKITGRGLIINDGDTEYSWDFILVPGGGGRRVREKREEGFSYGVRRTSPPV